MTWLSTLLGGWWQRIAGYVAIVGAALLAILAALASARHQGKKEAHAEDELTGLKRKTEVQNEQADVAAHGPRTSAELDGVFKSGDF